MDRQIAEKLIKILLELDEPFNSATEMIGEISSLDEQRVLRRGLAQSVGRVYTEVMLPIIRQYPDLDPGKKTRSE